MMNGEQKMVTYENVQGGRYRWITVTTLLLAIGAILHLVSPSIGGITPNWTIAMYCLAINLTRPTLKQAAGIGLVSAAINIPTSKAALPYANLVSEPIGAIVCAVLVTLSINMAIGKLNLRPGICGCLSTIFSGMTFVTITKLVLSLPMTVYLYGLVPVVLGVSVVNGIVTQMLYFPAQKLFNIKGEKV